MSLNEARIKSQVDEDVKFLNGISGFRVHQKDEKHCLCEYISMYGNEEWNQKAHKIVMNEK